MRSSLRITHVQPIAFDLFGHKDEEWGTKVRYFLPNMVSAQIRQGDRPTVHLLTSNRPNRMQVGGAEIRFHACAQLPRRYPVTARFGRQVSLSLLKSLRRETTDIIHFHGACSLHAMYGAVAWRARQQGIPMVSQDHGSRQGKWLENRLLDFAFRNTDGILAANEESRKDLRQRDTVHAPVFVQPNGYDPTVCFPARRSPRDHGSPFSILVVSRLWEDKDPLTMARGVAMLCRRHSNVDLTVIGQGVLRDRVELELKGAQLKTTFIEHIPQEELANHYRAADVLVLTSLREGWNQASIEAMACGLPVIATDIPGIRDGVADAGILIPPQRPDLLAEALELLMRTPQLALKHGELGVNRSAMYTWDSVTKALREAYEYCIERRHMLLNEPTAQSTMHHGLPS